MNTALQDTIEREITLKAPIERVYRALTDDLTAWFPKAIEGKVAQGENCVFDFGEYGKGCVHIVATDPHTYFAYRWVPGANNFVGDVRTVPNTLVEFRLAPIDEGTRLTMIESGFASLPAEHYAKAIEDNTGGWDYELAELVKYLEK